MATMTTNMSKDQLMALGAKETAAPTYMALIFIVSLVVPIFINVGPVLLMPHRLVLLVFFVPCLMRLWSGQAGPSIPADWLMFGSTIWAIVALTVNHGVGSVIESMGIHIVEFYGAYVLGRVAIRSSDDFMRFAKCAFMIALCLLPLAAIESITKRNIPLEIIPNSVPTVKAPYRWGMRRAQTLFTHPIHFGVFSAMGMGLYWYCIRPSYKRIISMPVVLLSTIFALSSGALICVVMQSMFIAYETVMKSVKSRWKIFGTFFAIIYVAIELTSNSGFFDIVVRYASFNTGSAYNRILIWQFGTQNVAENPIFGLGFREWVRPHWMSSSADNFWLLLTMMFGLPSGLAFIAAVMNVMWRSGTAVLASPTAKACQAGFLTASAGLIIGGGTVHYWSAMMALVLFFFGAGGWISTTPSEATDPETGEPMDADLHVADDVGTRYSRFTPSQTKPVVQAEAPQTRTATTHYSRNPTLYERRQAMQTSRSTKKS